MPVDPADRGLTVADLARRFRVSPDRVRRWIASGQLHAINRRDTRAGRPSYVVTAEALAAFEKHRAAAPSGRPRRRHRKRTARVDYYPGD
jgi:hypothetical protein